MDSEAKTGLRLAEFKLASAPVGYRSRREAAHRCCGHQEKRLSFPPRESDPGWGVRRRPQRGQGGAGCYPVLGEKVRPQEVRQRRKGSGGVECWPRIHGRAGSPGRPSRAGPASARPQAPEGVAWSSRSQTFHEPRAKNESGEECPPQNRRLSNPGSHEIQRGWGCFNSLLAVPRPPTRCFRLLLCCAKS